MSSLIPLAGPAVCAGLMAGMMWWMMRGMRSKGTGSAGQARDAEAPTSTQVKELLDENARLRDRVEKLDQPVAVADHKRN
jgi:hypothetical protein